MDSKPTGKQLFLMSKQGLDDLTIDEEEEISEVFIDEADREEFKQEAEEEEEEEFKYDRALYDADGLVEDVDFDDS